MSYESHIYLGSLGLKSPLQVRKGTQASAVAHASEVERKLGLVATRYKDNPAHWNTRVLDKVEDNDLLCETVIEHNRWVIWMHEALAECHKNPIPDGDPLTPEDARHGGTRWSCSMWMLTAGPPPTLPIPLTCSSRPSAVSLDALYAPASRYSWRNRRMGC